MGPRKQVGPRRGPQALLLPLRLQHAHEQLRAGPLCSQTQGAWWYVGVGRQEPWPSGMLEGECHMVPDHVSRFRGVPDLSHLEGKGAALLAFDQGLTGMISLSVMPQ